MNEFDANTVLAGVLVFFLLLRSGRASESGPPAVGLADAIVGSARSAPRTIRDGAS